MPVVAATCNPVVLVTSSILSLVLLVDLRLQAVIYVVVRRLLDHATTVRVPIRGRPLNEVLRQWCLLLILHLGRIVVRDLDWLVLRRVQGVSASVRADACGLMELDACPGGVVHTVGASLVL